MVFAYAERHIRSQGLNPFCATGMSSKLNNYVRTYRRRSSLRQEDVAFLLGSKNGAKVCRYEQGRRLPPLHTALALAIILDASPAALFSGAHHELQKEIAKRITMLRAKIEQKHRSSGRMPALVSRQLRWIDDHHGHAQPNEHRKQ